MNIIQQNKGHDYSSTHREMSRFVAINPPLYYSDKWFSVKNNQAYVDSFDPGDGLEERAGLQGDEREIYQYGGCHSTLG